MKTYEVSVSILSDSESPLEAVHELINFMACFASEATYEVRDTETNNVEIIELDQI